MKHTPGPWYWDSDVVKNDPLERVRYRVVTRGKTITQCYYSSDDENVEADARLIAAAPELLKELKAVEALYTNNKLLAQAHECGEWVNRARAAIAKAEGT